MEPAKSRNVSQEKSRSLASLQKSASNFVENCKLPILVFFHNAVTKKLEVVGDKTSVDLARGDQLFLTKADSILSTSVTSGNRFSFSSLVQSSSDAQISENPACPLPLLQFQMFGQY